MYILYLKGWNDVDENSVIQKILSTDKDKIICPDINYKITKNIINEFSSKIDRKPFLVVGNDIGAYFGFNICNKANAPGILFNPTFFFKNGAEFRPNGFIEGINSDIKIIISAKHKDMDVKRTIKYFDNIGISRFVKIYDDLDENIPYDVIQNEFMEFKKSIISIEKPKKEPKLDEPLTLLKKYTITYDL